LQFEVSQSCQNQSHVVYAHFVDGRVFYIGESSKTFRSRMRLYITHQGSTNVRVRKFIKRFLRHGRKVETFMYKPGAVLVDGLILVNPYVGVEQQLIKVLGRKIINKKDVGA
jgi:hypothetical protein